MQFTSLLSSHFAKTIYNAPAVLFHPQKIACFHTASTCTIAQGDSMKIAILIIALVMYSLVIAFQSKKVIFTTVAAAALSLIACAFRSPDLSALQALAKSLSHINFNVLMIYLGSMVIAALFIYSNMPTKIADFFVSTSPNACVAIVAILAMTGVISIFVENVATVLVMAPIALSLCKKLKLPPVHFITGLAVMSNLEGTATLVGDPPSMIFASFARFSFNDFFMYHGRVSIFFFVQSGLLAGCLYFWWKFRAIHSRCSVDHTNIRSPFPCVLLILMIVGLAFISSVSSMRLIKNATLLNLIESYGSGIFVFVLGIIGVIWYAFSQKKNTQEVACLIKDLDWETIFFLCGIFVVVGAVGDAGLLKDLSVVLTRAVGGSKIAGFVLILLVSIVISGFIDNVPYIIAMLPVAFAIAQSIGANENLYMFALLIGSCLGGNLTPFGASANVASIGILKKEGVDITFKDWLKIGCPFTLITTGVAAAFLWFVWS